jgi:hypothetical protein
MLQLDPEIQFYRITLTYPDADRTRVELGQGGGGNRHWMGTYLPTFMYLGTVRYTPSLSTTKKNN